MTKRKQQIFLLTGQQWLGVTLIVLLIITTLIVHKHRQPTTPTAITSVSDSTYAQFSSYQAQQDSIHKAHYQQKYKRDTIALHMQEFDPNTVDSITLRHLGLKG
jgi:hypothetical protein